MRALLKPAVYSANVNEPKPFKTTKANVKKKHALNIAEDTIKFAYKPVTDVLERIENRLERIEDILSYRFVETKEGTLMQKITYEDKE